MCYRFRLPLTLLLTVAALGVPAAQGPQPTMNVDEIRPGMVGIGRTVFDGTRVEEFKVNILGVLENVIGTPRNPIPARLQGGPLPNPASTAGMGGTPGTVDGRRMAAVFSAPARFPRDPTPA